MSNVLLEAIEEVLTADQVPQNAEPIPAPKLLTQVSQFIARYLQCSDHQRTVLTLWVLHTYCLEAAQITPYLYVHSAQKQSGKTLCLQLLNLLCDNAALTSGFTVSLLTHRLDGSISALLLDDCHATLGTRARSKNPAMQAILTGGFHAGLGYSEHYRERTTFRPKAFAGIGGLPETLADRSITIMLKPLKADAKVQRLRAVQVEEETRLLRYQLQDWSRENLEALKGRPPFAHKDFSPEISPRRRDLIEPLVQLADLVGGRWPNRIRQAVTAIFEEEAAQEMQPGLQLLADIRDCFAYHAYPERLSTATLLEWMHTRPARPWDIDGPMSATRLARLFSIFEIHPRYQRFTSGNPARGYQREDFQEPWQNHLDFKVSAGNAEAGASPLFPVPCNLSPKQRQWSEIDCGSPGLQAGKELAARSQKLGADNSQIANNHTACSMLHLPAELGSGEARSRLENPGSDALSPVPCNLSPITCFLTANYTTGPASKTKAAMRS